MRGLWLGLLVLAATQAQAAGEAIELRARGVQIYACEQASSGFQWRFKGPEAVLMDSAGAEVGRHFAGPSWRAADGSTVVGEVMAASPAPQAGAIPWLILRAKSHEGSGAYAAVTHIIRSHTQGGVAPGAPCDAQRSGSEARVPYEATYLLFRQP